MIEPKKLIEVAMPIKEISTESVTDVRIQHGHISSLHTWWARRPLPVCRAVIFASLVYDPLDKNCPKAFRDAVNILLGKENNPGDPYKPYDDIPWTSVYDPMEDNLRNRLQMFIGKFSSDMQKHLLGKSVKPESSNMLSNFSLIKWDSKNNNDIIIKARKLIWVAHNSKGNITDVNKILDEFELFNSKILQAENELSDQVDRHIEDSKNIALKNNLDVSIKNFLDKMPKVFDPFAGGGAIPLEASRLGCKSFGNDINPVAHILQKASLVYPQKFGKPIIYSKKSFIEKYNETDWQNLPLENRIYKNGETYDVRIENRLSFDVIFYVKLLLNRTNQIVKEFYPNNANGEKPIAYYWAHYAQCSNPSCKAEVPLLKDFYLVKNNKKSIFLNPKITENTITFEIKEGKCDSDPYYNKRKLNCPCCGNITDTNELKRQFNNSELPKVPRILAVISQGVNSKVYSLPTREDLDILKKIPETNKPSEDITKGDSRSLFITLWGIKKWGDMFSPRQLFTMNTLVKITKEIEDGLREQDVEYKNAILVYLAIFINRASTRLTSFGVWNPQYEKIQPIFSRQAIPMVFDFPEAVFDNTDGPIGSQLSWIIKVIESESKSPFQTDIQNASSGEKNQFPEKSITAVVTDPPYYDAIGYADLSDFFYVWFKQTLSNVFPVNFSTPLTPKSEECTALKHHHNGNAESAKNHFENKLLQIFDAIEYQTTDIVSIMFAHQSTEAWTTLCNSILGSKMNISGSWAIDTEITGALKVDKSFLTSSVTVSCVPSSATGSGDYKSIKSNIEETVAIEVEELYKLGFRGADLLTACFGKAVSEFGKYQIVEKADGSKVTVAELLDLARESAFNALLKGFEGDDYTKFYIAWLQLNSFTETDFDDAAKFTKIGLSINIHDLFKQHLLIKNGNKQYLGSMKDRIDENKKLGEGINNPIIDYTHKLMFLYGSPNRNLLLKYLITNSIESENPIWRVITSLAELLPKDMEDYKLAIGLLTNKDQLIREAKSSNTPKPEQSKLTFE